MERCTQYCAGIVNIPLKTVEACALRFRRIGCKVWESGLVDSLPETQNPQRVTAGSISGEPG